MVSLWLFNKVPFVFEMRKIKSPKMNRVEKIVQPFLNTYDSIATAEYCITKSATLCTQTISLLLANVVNFIPDKSSLEKLF
jgi:hypothetical protein